MEETITLIVPPWLIKTIDKGLQNLSYKEAAPAINEINRQIEQLKNTSTVKVDKPPDVPN